MPFLNSLPTDLTKPSKARCAIACLIVDAVSGVKPTTITRPEGAI